jgi:hypothetical protein
MYRSLKLQDARGVDESQLQAENYGNLKDNWKEVTHGRGVLAAYLLYNNV